MSNVHLVLSAVVASAITIAVFVVAVLYLRPLLEAMGITLSSLWHDVALLAVAFGAMSIASTPIRREFKRRARQRAGSTDA